MNYIARAFALLTLFMSFGFMNTAALAQETGVSQLPAHATDCSLYPRIEYDKEDGVSREALRRNPEENAARLCSGLPTYTGDLRMPTMTTWDKDVSLLFKVIIDRPNGHNVNGSTRMAFQTYLGSPTPMTNTPILADVAKTQNGNATLGQAAASAIPALTNGMGASAIQSFFGPCANGGCGGGGGGSVAYAISGSEATALLEASLGGGCGTGTCPTTAPPAHTTQPKGN
jgi:hypothetical protein